jgi:hypothetical protein
LVWRRRIQLDAAGFSIRGEARIGEYTVDVCPNMIDVVSIPKAGGETQMSNREGTDVIPELLKT